MNWPRIYEALEPDADGRLARIIRTIHHSVAIAGIGAAIAGTVPSWMDSHGSALAAIINLALACFAVEYVVRLAAAPGSLLARVDQPWRARLIWALSPLGISDLAAVLPMLVVRALNIAPEHGHLLGILWVCKVTRYSPGLRILARVVRNERELLLSVLLVFIAVLVGVSTVAHVIEGASQPDKFGTIPQAMWWAIVTITTTGYGDTVPVTPLGRALAGLVMISGILMFALWTGILAGGFAQEVRRDEFLRTWNLVAKVQLFRNLGADRIAEVVRLLRPRAVAAGATIVRRGERPDAMYFIVSGKVEIETETRRLCLGPGAFFGEIALITAGPRTATAVAVMPSVLLVLDCGDFHSLAIQRPDLKNAIQEEADRRRAENVPLSIG